MTSRSDQGGDRSRVADGSRRETHSSPHPILGGPVELGAKLRRGVPPDGDDLTHQRALMSSGVP